VVLVDPGRYIRDNNRFCRCAASGPLSTACIMRTDPHQHLDSAGAWDRTYLESLIREDFERCHPDDTLYDLKRRTSFSKEDGGLLRDWMAVAAARAAAACTAADDPLIREGSC